MITSSPARKISEHPTPPDLMYRLLVQSVKDYAIYLLDDTGVVLNWNAGAERAKGYRSDEIVGRNYECFYTEEDRMNCLPRRNLELALSNGHYATEGWRLRKDGTTFWASVALDAIYDDDGNFIGFAKVTRDLTEQRDAAKRFEHQATHDPLTGVLNRAGIANCLRTQLPQTMYGSSIAVHVIDLDRFKPINDTFGHSAGDEVLRQVALRLEMATGLSGVVGRFGGDEFVVLQFGSPDDEAIADLGEAIVECLRPPIQIGKATVTIGGCVGVAVAPRDGRDVDAIVRSADLAMYHAKSDGRNCMRFFDPTLNEHALARSLLQLKLHHAVAAKEFVLVYQPIVDGRSGTRVGFEALLRWTDQTGSSVPPSTFIPLAEELGLMPELGEWVLRTACREAAAWGHDLVVAINLSPMQLKQDGLAELVSDILVETGLPAHRLELEITETAVLEGLASARDTLSRLRGLGVGIALDDFGTGFSSLSLARELPLTRIKIDRSFVADLDEHNSSTAIVASVIALCRGYGLSATAEGVETEHQRAGLVASGCYDLQGYLFGRPAPASTWQIDTHPSPCPSDLGILASR